MSKKTATIIIVAIILLAAGGLLAFYLYSNRGQGGNIAPTGPGNNIFPNTPAANQNPPAPAVSPTPSGTGAGTSANPQTPSPLKELSLRPSAGAVALATSSNQLLVRFVEKGTGNVYEVGPETSGETRLSNTTIPRIQEVFWNKDGIHLIARYTKDGEPDTIETYYAELKNGAAGQPEGELKGSFLSENIKQVAENPEQNKLFYLLGSTGGATGIMSEFDGTKKTQVFDSPLQEWLPQWPTSKTITLTSRASASAPGFMFLLNAKTGGTSRAISGINGLTTLVAPDGVSVLYSESKDGGVFLKLYSLKTGASEDTVVETLPEKCVWSRRDSEVIYCGVPAYLAQGSYPDVWYQGAVSFSDDIWKINATTGAGELVANLKDLSGKDLDATSLFLSPNEDYLFFTNKNDFHVWSLKLNK